MKYFIAAILVPLLVTSARAQTSNGTLILYNASGGIDSNGAATGNIITSGEGLTPGNYYGQFSFSYTAPGLSAPGELKVWNSKGNIVADDKNGTGSVSGPGNRTGDWAVFNFPIVIAPSPTPTPVPTATPVPTPSPTPSASPTPVPVLQGAAPPKMPNAPPAAVTDCPNLAFSDTFNEGSNFQSELSEWGPLSSTVKWICNKADGFNFGGYYQPFSDTYTYSATSGHLVLRMHNYYQAPIPGSQSGDGNWYTGAIASAAWKNQTGGGTTTTGFLASAPCYWEAAVWVPPLTSCDIANAAGLWPSISLYTDPQLVSTVGSSLELDLFELYSINYTIPHFSWHIWSSGGSQLSAGGASPTEPYDFSQGWHVFGLWVDSAVIHWYLDGAEVFTAPNPGGVG